MRLNTLTASNGNDIHAPSPLPRNHFDDPDLPHQPLHGQISPYGPCMRTTAARGEILYNVRFYGWPHTRTSTPAVLYIATMIVYNNINQYSITININTFQHEGLQSEEAQ